jgi:hypothetical protein
MKTENIFLILGFLFSVVTISFHIENGFEFLHVQTEFSLLDVALSGSNETHLSSIFLGYFFYLIFGLVLWKKTNFDGKTLLLLFLLVTLLAMSLELKTIFEAFNGIYNGGHFRIGIPLALLGLFIAYRRNKTERNKKLIADNW